MSERIEQSRTDAPRATTGREWEVFVRGGPADPVTHAGSLTAPTREIAREQATQLFGWSVTDVWLCPADEIERFGGDSGSPSANSSVTSTPRGPASGTTPPTRPP